MISASVTVPIRIRFGAGGPAGLDLDRVAELVAEVTGGFCADLGLPVGPFVICERDDAGPPVGIRIGDRPARVPRLLAVPDAEGPAAAVLSLWILDNRELLLSVEALETLGGEADRGDLAAALRHLVSVERIVPGEWDGVRAKHLRIRLHLGAEVAIPESEWEELREQFFVSSGVVLPEPERVRDESLPAEGVRLQINDVRFPTVTTNELGTVPILLNALAPVFAVPEMVNALLDGLVDEKAEVVRSIRERYPLHLLAGIVRCLLHEGISVADFHSCLVPLLEDRGPCTADDRRFIVFQPHVGLLPPMPPSGDPRDPRALADLVRMGRARHLSHQYLAGRATLPVLLLDPEIERDPGRDPDDGEREALTSAILEAYVDAREQTPVLLTLFSFRRRLRQWIEKEIPELPVLCYQELDPALQLVPVTRIRL